MPSPKMESIITNEVSCKISQLRPGPEVCTDAVVLLRDGSAGSDVGL